MSKWIFQDIKDIKEKVLYGSNEPLKNIGAYNAELRKKVSPEVYVRYLIWQCDIYVDVFCIVVAAQNVYPDLSQKQIEEWVNLHKELHHILTY